MSKLAAVVLSFIKNRWPDRISYLSSEECSFISRSVPEGTKVNSSLVKLNYNVLSPFPAPETVYLASDTKILLWFLRPRPDQTGGGRIVLPEGLLLAKGYLADTSDAVLICRKESQSEFIIVKNGTLVSQFVKLDHNQEMSSALLALLCREHSLVSPDVQQIDDVERSGLLSRGLTRLSLKEISGFWLSGIKGNYEFLELAGKLLPAILLVILLYSSIQIGGAWFYKQKITSSRQTLESLQVELDPLLKQRHMEEKEVDFWSTFIENETNTLSLVAAYQLVAEAVLAVDGELIRWNGVKNSVTFMVLLDDAALLMNTLRQDARLLSVRFDGAVRKDRKTDRERATFRLELGAVSMLRKDE
ncbi:hypothetical protein JYT85_02125 [Desulfocapsa sp. AH-315-G09]|uniref:GspL cytoplasmic actin-ATPase-like domain-containing protein n=1 Tax=Desulfotalea psychrophila TaxID=84980 RepID=A0ABS3AVA8_9BACT|nr:hypothetical protein [Desulfocapsa sp.]MBN4065425.1 hypothetical protein [Desulfocapsa sp. AH-315-G09]MBN4068703.1 hypothetical protein [Desulfotalea psychrophila]